MVNISNISSLSTPRLAAPLSRGRLLAVACGAASAGLWLLVAAPAAVSLPANEPWGAWFDEVGVIGATMTVVRFVAIGLAAATALLSALHILPSSADVARIVTPSPLLPMFIALGSACSVPQAVPSLDDETAYLVRLAPPATASASPLATAPTTTLELVPTPPAVKAVAETERPSRHERPPPLQLLSPKIHTVVPGDHLWSIAIWTLEDAWHRPPTDDEAEPYWLALIAANRQGLPDPTNPDLIRPGQRIHLPPVPPLP